MHDPTRTSLTQRGLETFLKGFSATRSLTHPYPVRSVTPRLWLLADAPRTKGICRRSEVICYGAPPEEVIEVVRREEVGHHALCVLLDSSETPPAIRETYKRLGYRYSHAESLFVLPLQRRVTSIAHPVRRITEEEEVKMIRKAARVPLPPEHPGGSNAPMRLYGAFDDGTPVGWAMSVQVDSENTWVASLFVHADRRRQGIGRSLMSVLLDDDANHGAEYSALLASRTGALLYPHLGYEQHGVLLVFTARKDSASVG